MNAKKRIEHGRFLRRLGSVCTLCAVFTAPALGQDGGDQSVEVTDYGTVTLAVQDTDLAQVLEMLSIQSQKNIITSKNVAATISANLYDVTFYEALDAILKVNGYDYMEEGNFIYIYTQAEMDALAAATRKTESRIFTLNYLSATDANELIVPLLSDAGKSSFRGDVEPGIEPDTSDVGQDNWAFSAMLVVNDYPDNLDRVAELLGDLDVPPKQVLIEATILQTTLNEANAFGIDFAVLGNINFTDLTNPLSLVDNLLSGSDGGVQPGDNKALGSQSTVGNTAGRGGLKIGILKDDFAAFLRVLDEVTDSVVLARPKIMCLNRQRAEVLVGRRVGYLSTTATETSTTQTVEFLDTGINLMFRPFIADNGMIRLEMSPSVSEAFLRDQTNAAGATVTIPDELTNELTTNVRIADGNTLVLGGLFRESTQVSRRQVPILGDIPILGEAFKGQDDAVDRTEITFLITPNIVHDEALWAIGKNALEYDDALRVGIRAGLLPWSKEKTSASANNRALESFNDGDLDMALYHINNSLRINSNQPEILQFRARILGAMDQPHERDIMERVIREEIRDAMPLGVGSISAFEPVGSFGFDAGVTSAAPVAEPFETIVVEVATDEVTAVTAKPEAYDEPVTTDTVETENVSFVTEPVTSETPAAPAEMFSYEVVESAETATETTTEPDMFQFEVEETSGATPVTIRTSETFPAEAADSGFDMATTTTTTEVEMFPFEIVEATEEAPKVGVLHQPLVSFEAAPEVVGSVDATTTDTDEPAVSLVSGTVTANRRPGAGDDQFVDRFIQEYFEGLGVADISTEESGENQMPVEEEAPFATFDDVIETILPEEDEDE